MVWIPCNHNIKRLLINQFSITNIIYALRRRSKFQISPCCKLFGEIMICRKLWPCNRTYKQKYNQRKNSCSPNLFIFIDNLIFKETITFISKTNIACCLWEIISCFPCNFSDRENFKRKFRTLVQYCPIMCHSVRKLVLIIAILFIRPTAMLRCGGMTLDVYTNFQMQYLFPYNIRRARN